MKVNVDKVCNIISEKIHGKEFYDKMKLTDLINFLEDFNLQINDFEDKNEIISKINKYIKSNVKLREEYYEYLKGDETEFDFKETKYRTAYSALINHEATTSGIAESLRILFSLYDIESKTLLSVLNNKQDFKILEYVVAAKISEKNWIILDPIRELACEKNGLDYEKQKENTIYIMWNEEFCSNKILDTGFGIEGNEFLDNLNVSRCLGTQNLNNIV